MPYNTLSEGLAGLPGAARLSRSRRQAGWLAGSRLQAHSSPARPALGTAELLLLLLLLWRRRLHQQPGSNLSRLIMSTRIVNEWM